MSPLRAIDTSSLRRVSYLTMFTVVWYLPLRFLAICTAWHDGKEWILIVKHDIIMSLQIDMLDLIVCAIACACAISKIVIDEREIKFPATDAMLHAIIDLELKSQDRQINSSMYRALMNILNTDEHK